MGREGKRKKKGRPSLLDLQKRSLRLQKQHDEQQKHKPNPSPPSNPYLRPHNAVHRSSVSRRSSAASDSDSGDGSRREKKLRSVCSIPDGPVAAPDRPSPAFDAEDREKAERPSSGKATGRQEEEEPSDSGPTTPLPDKVLLIFILDRLQKKDTYGVFSEPVDPNELPDYHNIIEHPMDFGTVRNKLSSGAYENLEQFEKDVFLISSNAMQYNSPDTVYFRQARAIQELAKKDFDSLRQDSDDEEEQEQKKMVRRGRPPKKPTGRPNADRDSTDFVSNAHLSTSGNNNLYSRINEDASNAGPAMGGLSSTGPSYSLRNRSPNWRNDTKFDKSDEYPGHSLRGAPSSKSGKKSASVAIISTSIIDDNRRRTYDQPDIFASSGVNGVLNALDGERKHLIPVGLFLDQAYARSLARFAANLGPVAWEIASKKIQRSLPPGTKFGPGWVGDSEAPPQPQPPLLSSSPSRAPQDLEHSLDRFRENDPAGAGPGAVAMNSDLSNSISDLEGGPPQHLKKHNTINGYYPQFGFGPATAGEDRTSGGENCVVEKPRAEAPPPDHRPKDHSGVASQQGLETHRRPPGTSPPDLNLRFQPRGSTTVDTQQQPDLALQL